jgi:hypothetical protein
VKAEAKAKAAEEARLAKEATQREAAAAAAEKEQQASTDDAEMENNTNEFINEMNNPRNPDKSPVKKKSKKDALNYLFTSKQKAAKPTPAPSTTTNSSNKRKKDETIDLTANDPSWKEVATKCNGTKVKVTPQPKPTKQPASIFKKPHVWTHSRIVVDASLDLAAPALAHYDKGNCKKMVHALKDLIKNLASANKHAALCHKDAAETTHIGGALFFFVVFTHL